MALWRAGLGTLWCLLDLLRNKTAAIRAATPMTPTLMPTPMPALAPVESSEDDACGDAVAVFIELVDETATPVPVADVGEAKAKDVDVEPDVFVDVVFADELDDDVGPPAM